MKKFLSENRKTMVKLLTNRFGAVVFSLMLSLATVKSESSAVFILGSAVSVLFHYYLIYLTVWERGATDRIRADGKRIPREPHYGLKIGLVAAFPGFVLAVLIFSGTVFGAAGGTFETPFFAELSSICKIIAMVWQIMYIGIFKAVGSAQSVLRALLYFAVLIPEIFVIWISYLLGYHGKLMSYAYRKNKKD